MSLKNSSAPTLNANAIDTDFDEMIRIYESKTKPRPDIMMVDDQKEIERYITFGYTIEWIYLKQENDPNFCKCGIILHDDMYDDIKNANSHKTKKTIHRENHAMTGNIEMVSVGTQTTIPNDTKTMREIVEGLGINLRDQYDDQMLFNHNGRGLTDDLKQIILSFYFPKIRGRYLPESSNDDRKLSCRYNVIENAYNYCRVCKKFKSYGETTNQFCMKHYNEYATHYCQFDHEEQSICYDCLDHMMNYGDTTDNPRFKKCCPICRSKRRFHYINHKCLYRSHPCFQYVRDQLLKYNTTTTKKINLSQVKRSSYEGYGKNWEQFRSRVDQKKYLVNINSYQFKFNLLHQILRGANRSIYGDMDLEYMTNNGNRIIEYAEIDRTRQGFKDLIDDLNTTFYISTIYDHTDIATYPLDYLITDGIVRRL